MPCAQRIALIGPRGAGKSTVAPLLGEALGLPALDLDAAIAEVIDEDLDGFIKGAGWAVFRVVELETLAALLCEPRFVIACGAGLLETPQAYRLLADATELRLWLDLEPSQQRSRLAQDERPALHPKLSHAEELLRVDRRRRPLYTGLASRRIDATADLSKVLSSCLATQEQPCAPP